MTTNPRAPRTRQADLPVDLSTLDPKMLGGLARAAKKKLSAMRLATFQPYGVMMPRYTVTPSSGHNSGPLRRGILVV